jgi:hypothetical protein
VLSIPDRNPWMFTGCGLLYVTIKWDTTQPNINTSFPSNTLLIIPTDAHYYKSVAMLKQIKSYNTYPTCFGSRRNHHQEAVLCLATTTDMVFFCARRYGLSQCYGGISNCWAGVRSSTGLLPDDDSCVNRNMSGQVLYLLNCFNISTDL